MNGRQKSHFALLYIKSYAVLDSIFYYIPTAHRQDVRSLCINLRTLEYRLSK